MNQMLALSQKQDLCQVLCLYFFKKYKTAAKVAPLVN